MLAYSGISCRIYVDDFTKRKQCCRKFIVLHFGLCLDRNRCVQRYYVCKDSENEDNKFPWIRKKPTLVQYSNCIFIVYGIPYFRRIFFAKMVLFNQTIQAGYIALVIVAVVNSIISVGYYFKLILAMYTKNLMKKEQELLVIYAVAVIAMY
jgi:NADH-quinone oxidoreductase subunit N